MRHRLAALRVRRARGAAVLRAKQGLYGHQHPPHGEKHPARTLLSGPKYVATTAAPARCARPVARTR